MEFILKVQSGDIPRNLAILSMPTLQGVLHLYLIGGGAAARTEVRYINTFGAVLADAERCLIWSLRVAVVSALTCHRH